MERWFIREVSPPSIFLQRALASPYGSTAPVVRHIRYWPSILTILFLKLHRHLYTKPFPSGRGTNMVSALPHTSPMDTPSLRRLAAGSGGHSGELLTGSTGICSFISTSFIP